MAVKLNKGCIKMSLPNGKVVDILTDVLDEISCWIQNESLQNESGGYIVGYQHKKTGNIVLESVSAPYSLDNRSRIHFDMKDPKHRLFLLKAKKRKSYYMGVWHTHPQSIPTPSNIDWEDWRQTLVEDKTACEYIFYIIAGTNGMRVWVGNKTQKTTEEIYECGKEDGLYYKD